MLTRGIDIYVHTFTSINTLIYMCVRLHVSVKRKEQRMKVLTYALFPCPGTNVLPSERVTGSKGEPEANTHLLQG